jgi:hypothetical protein
MRYTSVVWAASSPTSARRARPRRRRDRQPVPGIGIRCDRAEPARTFPARIDGARVAGKQSRRRVDVIRNIGSRRGLRGTRSRSRRVRIVTWLAVRAGRGRRLTCSTRSSVRSTMRTAVSAQVHGLDRVRIEQRGPVKRPWMMWVIARALQERRGDERRRADKLERSGITVPPGARTSFLDAERFQPCRAWPHARRCACRSRGITSRVVASPCSGDVRRVHARAQLLP